MNNELERIIRALERIANVLEHMDRNGVGVKK